MSGNRNGSGGAIPTIDPMRVVRQYFWWLVASVIIGAFFGGAAHVVLMRTNPVFTSEGFFRVNPPSGGDVKEISEGQNVSAQVMERILATEALAMIQPTILNNAIKHPSVRETVYVQSYIENGSLLTEQAVEGLQSQVTATPYSDSQMVRVALTGPSANDVTRMLASIMDAYEDHNQSLKARTRSSYSESLLKRKSDLDDELEQIEEDLEEYIARHNVPHNPNFDADNIEVTQLVTSIRQDKDILGTLRGQNQTLQSRLADPAAPFTDEERRFAETDPQVLGFETQLLELQRELRSMRTRYGANHRTVRLLEEQVSATQAEREDELRAVLERNLLINIQQVQNQLNGLEQALSLKENELAAKRTRVAELSVHQRYIESRQSERQNLAEQIAALSEHLLDANFWFDQKNTNVVTLVEPASRPTSPSFPKLFVMLPLGVLLIGGLTSGAVFLRELTDQRVRGPNDIAVLPHGQLLGVIPHLSEEPSRHRKVELLSLKAPRGLIAESVRQLRNNVMRTMDQFDYRSLVIMGGQPGTGTTALITNLAVSFGHSERRVLIIDANFRRPQMSKALSVDSSPGLGDALGGAASITEVVQETKAPGVSVITAGSAEHRVFERLTTGAFRAALDRLEADFDIILIDAPAAVAAGDSLAVADCADASMLVVRAMREERGLVARMIRQLNDARATHLGVVLNAVRSETGGYLKRNFRHMEAYQKDVA